PELKRIAPSFERVWDCLDTRLPGSLARAPLRNPFTSEARTLRGGSHCLPSESHAHAPRLSNGTGLIDSRTNVVPTSARSKCRLFSGHSVDLDGIARARTRQGRARPSSFAQ